MGASRPVPEGVGDVEVVLRSVTGGVGVCGLDICNMGDGGCGDL